MCGGSISQVRFARASDIGYSDDWVARAGHKVRAHHGSTAGYPVRLKKAQVRSGYRALRMAMT
jgi:hypothetical protein